MWKVIRSSVSLYSESHWVHSTNHTTNERKTKIYLQHTLILWLIFPHPKSMLWRWRNKYDDDYKNSNWVYFWCLAVGITATLLYIYSIYIYKSVFAQEQNNQHHTVCRNNRAISTSNVRILWHFDTDKTMTITTHCQNSSILVISNAWNDPDKVQRSFKKKCRSIWFIYVVFWSLAMSLCERKQRNVVTPVRRFHRNMYIQCNQAH